MDKKKIQKAVHDIIVAVGENPNREGLKETPRRVSEFYCEALSGQLLKPEDVLTIYSYAFSEYFMFYIIILFILQMLKRITI